MRGTFNCKASSCQSSDWDAYFHIHRRFLQIYGAPLRSVFGPIDIHEMCGCCTLHTKRKGDAHPELFG